MTPVDEKDIWHNYSPKEAWRALGSLAGSWASTDTDKLAEDIRLWRRTGSRA